MLSHSFRTNNNKGPRNGPLFTCNRLSRTHHPDMIDPTKILRPEERNARSQGLSAKSNNGKNDRTTEAAKDGATKQKKPESKAKNTTKTPRNRNGNKNGNKNRNRNRNKTGKQQNRTQRTKHPIPYVGTIGIYQNKLYSSSPLEKVLTEHHGPNNHNCKDHYRWLVSSIVYVGAMNKRYRQDNESYVPLNYEMLRTMLPKRQLTPIIMDLIRWGVIERNESYRNGHRSMGYRLNVLFPIGKFRVRLITNRRMNQKINSHRSIMEKRICVNPAYAAVYRTVEALSIKERRARRKVNRDFDPSVLEDKHRYDSRMIGIDSIALHHIFHAIDPKTGRYYHSYACLARELRPMVQYEGFGLREIDITNSQPLLLHLLLKEKRMVRPTEGERMEKLVLNGLFYEEFNTNGLDRQVFKKEFYRDVLFGKGLYSNDTTKLFRRKFPSYAAAIRNIKYDDHRRLAIAMQTMEAEIIFAAVERFIGRYGPNAPIVTIHDSLSTTPDYCEGAMEVLYEVFMERFGIRPHLKVK